MKFNTFSEKMIYKNIDMPIQNRSNRAPLILFEGIDLSGKTTQIRKLFEYFSVFLNDLKFYNEPTDLNNIRSIVLDREKKKDFFGNFLPEKNEEIIDYYLFMASRAHLFHLITRDLKNMNPVFLDRDFISSYVYQNSIEKVGTEIARYLKVSKIPLSTDSILKRTDIDTKISDSVLKVSSLGKVSNIDTKVTNLVTKVSKVSSEINIIDDCLKLYKYFSLVNNFSDGFSGPDLILFFDIDYNTYMNRIMLRAENNHYDNINPELLMERINLYRDCIEILIHSNKISSKIIKINGNQSVDMVYNDCVEAISKYLDGYNKVFKQKDGVF